jgi:hypothetical protein
LTQRRGDAEANKRIRFKLKGIKEKLQSKTLVTLTRYLKVFSASLRLCVKAYGGVVGWY